MATLREDVINHSEEESYVKPTDRAVLDKLEWFQDQKLALMVHWGGYSQLGMCESWPISDGDAYWSRTAYTYEPDSAKFREQYFDLARTFNPIRFEPDAWAGFAKAAGFRYLIFTTKHHDGFCMYDTHETDYKVTGELCPFHTHKYANIAKCLFDAFRQRGLGIAAYFSKADWHCADYWAEGCEHPVAWSRNPTYDPEKEPARWRRFVDFTHKQMMELATELGPLDVMWLDAGWVNPRNKQDIDMASIAQKTRTHTPGLIYADRTVGGAYENYITPEQQIPSHVLMVPWESCVSVGDSFAYSFEDRYKTPRALVILLIDTVTRGGNLALNIGAQPDGRLPRAAMEAAMGLGNWLRENGEAIYGTRAADIACESGLSFTRKGNRLYALKPLKEGQICGRALALPQGVRPQKATLTCDGRELTLENTGDATRVLLPVELSLSSPLALAVTLEG